MIDIENYIFDYIAKKLRTNYDGITVSGEYIPMPSKFPCVTIEEKDNSVKLDFRTTNIENMAQVMYEVNVYSNKTSGRKAEARKVMQSVDGYMSELGLTRTMINPIPNLEDSTIYRLVARYEADVDKTVDGTNENYMIYQR